MTTLEEQLRRYATDVAGPARGPAPPLRAGGRGPAPVGRLLLVAVLVVFVAGSAWLVVRASSTAREQMVPAGPEVHAVPEPTSWGGELGHCTDTMAGIPLHGPDGEGLCIGFDRDPSGVVNLWFTDDAGTPLVTTFDECRVVRDSHVGTASGGSSLGVRPSPVWVDVSPYVGRVIATTDRGRRVIADTVHVPGIAGARFAAFRLDPGDELSASLELYATPDTPLTPGGQVPALPERCGPMPQVPTPSDSEEWEDRVLDHRGEVRGRTAGLVELHEGLWAYRVVDDSGQLAGYTMVDGGIGFVDRPVAEDPAILRRLVACGNAYTTTLAATPECAEALATIGIDTSPPAPSGQ
jgi:hypothetical protein